MVAGLVRYRILLVDDDPWMLRALRRLLEVQFDIDLAQNIGTAVARLSVAIPDIVISDLNIGPERGEELLAILRRDYPSVSRIAISGADSARLEALLENGLAEAIIEKGVIDSAQILRLLQIECVKRVATDRAYLMARTKAFA